ncbi:MAG TPA: type II toxin-antitoxin system ParD family antitoxin [Devosia sp.]|jgi:antitoxin ParD1/3/4|uniref:type II toxin-antitoxin system ParD family antitoxin n=1 Tax=Devosia sp. TaxID=1871048 RepID=UPI002DDDAB14|nr:type II toxin-antitoxin system ParD family antitoxin [Devosia sp.]HEV2515781.1 type II toxin-antitoxin system ParD family antitoxin [Devosia sp.]
MAMMNISLPDKMKQWVEEQVATGRYANASDLIRDLIREDQDRAMVISELQAMIDEADASGISDRTVEDIRRDVRRELGLSDDADAA